MRAPLPGDLQGRIHQDKRRQDVCATREQPTELLRERRDAVYPTTVCFLGWVKVGEQRWVNSAESLSNSDNRLEHPFQAGALPCRHPSAN